MMLRRRWPRMRPSSLVEYALIGAAVQHGPVHGRQADSAVGAQGAARMKIPLMPHIGRLARGLFAARPRRAEATRPRREPL